MRAGPVYAGGDVQGAMLHRTGNTTTYLLWTWGAGGLSNPKDAARDRLMYSLFCFPSFEKNL